MPHQYDFNVTSSVSLIKRVQQDTEFLGLKQLLGRASTLVELSGRGDNETFLRRVRPLREVAQEGPINVDQ